MRIGLDEFGQIEDEKLEAQQRAALRRALLESEPTSPRLAKAVPSPAELRGIPVCAPGVGGHIRGTHPEQEVCRA